MFSGIWNPIITTTISSLRTQFGISNKLENIAALEFGEE